MCAWYMGDLIDQLGYSAYGTDCGVRTGLSLRFCRITPKLLSYELGQS